MIRLISGVYGARGTMKRPDDGPFSLSDSEEARLVRRGVAEYVFEAQSAAADDTLTLPAYDIGMTEKQLRGIAAYFQVDVNNIRGKKNIVAALDAYFAANGGAEPDEDGGDAPDEDDGGVPPELGAELPTA